MKHFYFLILCLSLSVCVTAQDGSLDETFNPSDIGFGAGFGLNSTIRTLLVQDDGKILIAGEFITDNGTQRYEGIARLNSDGSLDTSFNADIQYEINTFAVQSDGKILIAGSFATNNGTEFPSVARLHSDGSLDTSFSMDGVSSYGIETIAIQADGKILIGGSRVQYRNATDTQARNRKIARLNSDGTLDMSFDVGTGFDWNVESIAVQADGKILVGGLFTRFNGQTANRLARLNTDGSLDASFNIGGFGSSGKINKVLIQADGKILIGGVFTRYNGKESNRIARLHSDGSLDTSFNVGTGFNIDINRQNCSVETLAIQANGKILVGGKFTSYNDTASNRIARLNTDGSLDTSLNVGTGLGGGVWAISERGDGKVLIAGGFKVYNGLVSNCIGLLNRDGSLDTSFNRSTGVFGTIKTITGLSDGKVVIGGSFVGYNGTAMGSIARLHSDGSLDTSFDVGTALWNVETIAVQTDGKLLVGGAFSSINGIQSKRIARLNTDGSLDTSFDVGKGVDGWSVFSISVQPDGKVLIGGSFRSFNETEVNSIARLNTDGSLDTTFNTGSGVDGNIFSTVIQSDGKILIGGFFKNFNGKELNGLARLNSDGSLDISFNVGAGADPGVSNISLQADGKILISGNFTSYDGNDINRVALLNSDGSLDTGFNEGTGTNDFISSLSVQDDGKILIGGSFTSYNDIESNYLARLNSDGSLDTSFDTGIGPSSNVNTLLIQDDQKILIGGSFISYNGIGRNGIARINTSTLGIEDKELTSSSISVFKQNDILYVENRKGMLQAVNVFDITGRRIFEFKDIKSSKLEIANFKMNNQCLVVKIIDENNSVTTKKIVIL